MKLTELNPHWYILEKDGPVIGLTLDCPHCKATRLAVPFHHSDRAAMEDAYILAHAPSTGHIWTVTGDSFENLSLSPSVDASNCGHWHGFITNGEAT